MKTRDGKGPTQPSSLGLLFCGFGASPASWEAFWCTLSGFLDANNLLTSSNTETTFPNNNLRHDNALSGFTSGEAAPAVSEKDQEQIGGRRDDELQQHYFSPR